MSDNYRIEGVDELVINGTTFHLPGEDLHVTVIREELHGSVMTKRVAAEITGEVYVESGTELGDFVTPVEDAYDDE